VTRRKSGDARKKTYEPGDPFAEGWDAAVAGGGVEANPYEEGTRERQAWLEGFRSYGTDEE
jgi:ribosome modulation factor